MEKMQTERRIAWLMTSLLLVQLGVVWSIFFYYYYLLWFYGPSRLFHSFWAESIIRWGEKGRSLRNKHLTTRKQTLACLTCDPSYARTHSGEMTNDLERLRLASLYITTRPWSRPWSKLTLVYPDLYVQIPWCSQVFGRTSGQTV